MPPFLDARLPVRFADHADPGEALLVEGQDFDAATGHAPGCACCVARSPAAEALTKLFIDRARSTGTPISRVAIRVSSDAGRRAIEDAIRSDRVASLRFRLDPAP